MKLFSLGFRVVAHVPCYLSEAVMFLFSALSLYFHLIFIVTFPPGIIRMNFELVPKPNITIVSLGTRVVTSEIASQ